MNMILCFMTEESGQTLWTKLTLEQSDAGIHCFHLHLLEESLYDKTSFFLNLTTIPKKFSECVKINKNTLAL